MKWLTFLLVTLSSLGIGNGDIISFSPPTNPSNTSITYSLTIPNSTTLSTPGPIYIQITAPTTIQWIGLGQGSQMTNSNMFILYTSSSSKIHPRTGITTTNSTTFTNDNKTITTMTANLRCDNCLTWQNGAGTMNPLDPNFPFIWAYKVGVPINSAALDADLSIHDYMGQVRVDLTQATLPERFYSSNSTSTTLNPFLNYNPVTDSTILGTTPPSTSTSNPNPNSNGSIMATHIPKNMTQILIAHATLMALAFAIFFPLGALIMPIPISIKKFPLHTTIQLLTLTLTLAGLGTGIYLARTAHQLTNPHPIIGIVVVGILVLVQPVLGMLQHRRFKESGRPGGRIGVVHRWVGRGGILLGMVNGGLGFRLAGVGGRFAPVGAVVGYAVVVGVVGMVYLGVLGWGVVKGRKTGGSDVHSEGGGEVEREGRGEGDGEGEGQRLDGEKGGVVMEER
ncbi:iron reductase domain protein [Aspergillus carbonarius ITEM 5010]|uniref:Iron reductase domain protein n=1 Tax=Aspergillus carbonarius (strain ITEM 5010) TaxID=602072 RepID=A0A1R3RAI4_ASPC5|nr:iron reductase domain protein [Aspergillus carbonarius ITEM 5010]